ncbi:DMT family transporter [Thalassolituus sp. C2-1]|uniref:DMT family transporter n=1 Tax=Venatorbacter sp. C2-1 TaxID=2597518 RepID=UPI00118FACA1|nr:DMT family transporter [Thalassolituus sp. C2-1]TVV45725.1 DMT family transporter [Thalassolituus sp. C2-1]
MLTNRHPAFLAALWMSGALLSFMLMAISGRELSHSLTTYQILFFRSVIGVLVISILLSRSGWQQIRTQRLKTHWLRNIAHYAGQYGWFYGLAFIPLAEVIAIEFTTPVWTALLAFFLLKERLTGARLQALVLGIAGLLLILRPGAGVLQPAAFAVLGGALGYAFSYIQTKSLTRTDTPLCILFYMTLMQLPFGLVPSVLNWTTLAAETLPWILLVGITAMSAHFCMAHAFRLADATVVVPMDFLRLPLIAVVGYLFYQESIDLFVLAGAVLMFSGNLLNLRAEYRRN